MPGPGTCDLRRTPDSPWGTKAAGESWTRVFRRERDKSSWPRWRSTSTAVVRTTRDLRGRCGVRLASARQDCGRLGGDPARNPSACRLLVNSGPLSRHGHTPCQFRINLSVRYHRGTGTGCGGNDRDSLAPRTAGSRSANAAQLSTRRLSRASLTRGLGVRRGGLQQALHPSTEP